MYPSCTFSIRHLLILTIVLPGVLLNSYSNNYVDNVVNICERESLAIERRYAGRGDEGTYGQGKKNSQKIFECISGKVQRPILDISPEYQKLKLQCELEQEDVVCDSLYPYRTIDGKCNNLHRPKWGSAHTCMEHFLPPYYEGASDFRRSVCGTPLPEPRILSLSIFKIKDDLDGNFSNMFPFFSQVVAHDIVDTQKSTVGGDCCSRLFHGHPQCAPIHIPPKDSLYTWHGVTCLNFVRAEPCRTCSLGKRNTMNQQTSFIDCSFVYGPTEKEARKLRRNDGTGKMIVQPRAEGDLLPPDLEAGPRCGAPEKQEYCFKTGDKRSNQHTPLAAFHTIFLREHNRVAETLKQLNPGWGEERLYQEARKIVIAEIQVIIYKEFLPQLLGSEIMRAYNLALSDGWSFYNPQSNPTIYSEFTNGAFRLHAMIPTVVTKLGINGVSGNLSEFMNHSAAPIYRGEMDTLLEGMCWSPSGVMNTYTSWEIKHLRQNGKHPGIDLIAADIQRGRDTGMPPYTELIRFLSKGKINIRTFSDLAEIFEPKDVKLLQSLYCDPRDIDYFVGMHFKPQRKEGMMFHSAADIIARQFKKLKFGDRFFFEHFGNFNKNQLLALKEVTLSTLICENTILPSIQVNAMQIPSSRNPIKPCEAIPKLSLKFWKAKK